VKRNSTIDGILSQSSHVGRSDCSGDNEIDNHIPPLYDIEHHDLLTEVGESHMGFELSASASKKPSNITYKVLKGVLDDFAQTCISQGIGNEAYGCAVQLLNVARTGGDLVEGNLEEIIHGYQNMFSSTQTKNVTFTLSQGSALHHEECDVQVPNLPITKIGSRACETRMKPASEHPIKGNNTPRGCGFCEKVGHKITKCSELSDFGVRLTNGAKSKSPDQYKQLSSYLNAVITNSSFDQFATWPTDNDSPMVEGVPKTVQHLVIHGFFSYTPTNSHPQIVVAVQFLLQGGIPLAAYSFVPMTVPVPELIKVLYANFLANKKCVIVHNVLHPCIGSMS
jgi:hypothetical protein